jgi:hypothetical protein
MLPLFKAGDVALIESSILDLKSEILPGDCAVYEFEGRKLLHRVVKTDAGGAWFSDDAGRINSHYVPWTSVTGRVVDRNPLAGGLAGFYYSKCKRAAFSLLNFLRFPYAFR